MDAGSRRALYLLFHCGAAGVEPPAGGAPAAGDFDAALIVAREPGDSMGRCRAAGKAGLQHHQKTLVQLAHCRRKLDAPTARFRIRTAYQYGSYPFVVIMPRHVEGMLRAADHRQGRPLRQYHLSLESTAAISGPAITRDFQLEAGGAGYRPLQAVQQPAFLEGGVGGAKVIERHYHVVDAVIGKDAARALDPAGAVRAAAGARIDNGVCGRAVGDGDAEAVFQEELLHAAGVIKVTLLTPFGIVDGRGVLAPARTDAALAAVVGDGARGRGGAVGGNGRGIVGIGDRDGDVGNGLIGVIEVMIGAVIRAVEPAVDSERAALVKGEGALVEVAVRPEVVAGLEGHVGGVRRPVAAGDNEADAVEILREGQLSGGMRVI